MSITFVIGILQNVIEVNINEYYICYCNITKCYRSQYQRVLHLLLQYYKMFSKSISMSITFVITMLQNVLEVNINEYYICYYNITKCSRSQYQ